jgi:hypothetical protein
MRPRVELRLAVRISVERRKKLPACNACDQAPSTSRASRFDRGEGLFRGADPSDKPKLDEPRSPSEGGLERSLSDLMADLLGSSYPSDLVKCSPNLERHAGNCRDIRTSHDRPLEVGEHQDVEQLGAGSGTERVEALTESRSTCYRSMWSDASTRRR